MMDMNEASAEVAALAGAGVIEPYGYPPDSPAIPCVYVEEWESDLAEDNTPLGDGRFYTMTLVILVARSDDREARGRRNDLIKGTIEAMDVPATYTNFSDLFIGAARAPADLREFNGDAYVAAEIDVQVFG